MRTLFSVLIAAAITAPIAAQSPAYVSLDDNGSQIRSDFNADSGKVRVLMLVAPT